MENQIEIYTSSKGIEIAVLLENETLWATQKQMAEIFDTTPQNITIHLKNVYGDAEIDEDSTCKEFLQVQTEGKRKVQRKQLCYNLDAILSVGYRVNSKRGTQFRQWATQRLKDYLVQGYAINQKRLDELGNMVQLIEQSGKTETLQLQEAKGLLEILGNYTKSFLLLNQYDSHNLQAGRLNENITYEIEYDEAKNAIAELKRQLMAQKEATELFGNEKDESFKSSLRSIVQTFDGQYLYPSIEEQAAHLLYFVIKNHSFTDGNKRIGAFLFVWFLEKNKHRFKSSGELKINDNGLIAIALLVAQSKPEEKEIIIQLIVALIADNK
ncbi:MAG: virulence protein RhuM/Fic/DOC family protein [Bacteroidetes bacterium]|jgi:death-on-curing family protein|nr:virulence protein RhuM/Fic/DOC family protein [Bacteroidota bacterium]